MAVLRFHHLERAGGPVAGQVAEHDEMVAANDLGLQLGIGLLPALEAGGLDLLVDVLRRQPGESGCERTCSGLAAYDVMGFLGSSPSSSLAPCLTHCSIVAIASSDRILVAPWGIRGVSSPLIRKTRWLSLGLAGDDDRLVVRPFWLPFCSFSNVVRSSLPFLHADPITTMATDAIGDENRRNIL